MRVLITGVCGFAGMYLAKNLARRGGAEITGTVHKSSNKGALGAWQDCVRFRTCDLRDASGVRALVEEVRPDRIFHLAGQTFVPASWKDPVATFDANVIGELNLLEAVRRAGLSPLIHIACSSDEYGAVAPKELPIGERTLLRPVSPYAVSKAAQDLLAFGYHHSFGQKIIRTRAFSHAGPGQRGEFALSNFARQIALIEAGRQKPEIRVGNLEAVRDFSDVRDIAEAYRLALEKGEPGEVYNICSGKGRRIADALNVLLGFTRTKIRIRKDPGRLRTADVPRLVGDASKFRKRTGWRPAIPFERTLKDLLDDWRRKVVSGAL